jgi:hypothetical protein
MTASPDFTKNLCATKDVANWLSWPTADRIGASSTETLNRHLLPPSFRLLTARLMRPPKPS